MGLFDLFKKKPKKHPPLNELPDEDQWNVAQGENNGNPMIVRINAGIPQYAGHPHLPIRLGIAVPLNKPDENGFPGPAESEQLNEIEDTIDAMIGKSGRVVLVITTSGMREFVSYISSEKLANSIIPAIQNNSRQHQIQHYTQADPQWEMAASFAG